MCPVKIKAFFNSVNSILRLIGAHMTSVTRKKSRNVYKSCPKIISPEKWLILTSLQKLRKNGGDLNKLIFAKGFKKLPKVQKIAQSGHPAHIVSTSRRNTITATPTATLGSLILPTSPSWRQQRDRIDSNDWYESGQIAKSATAAAGTVKSVQLYFVNVLQAFRGHS